MTNTVEVGNGKDCAPHYRDPRDQIFAGLNEIMFRTGLHAAQTKDETWLKSRIDDDLEINTIITGIPQSPVDLFKSNFNYFAAAAAVELFTIFLVAFTFYGWWRLGRNMSFSPLEVAKVRIGGCAVGAVPD